MKKCEKCGKKFDEEEVYSEFPGSVDSPFPLSYDMFDRDLCLECAIEQYENGNYLDECESCGKRIYPPNEQEEFERLIAHKVYEDRIGRYGILCAECAAERCLQEVRDRSCDWWCDKCGAYLNDQENFTVEKDRWKCAECGHINDVSYDNII